MEKPFGYIQEGDYVWLSKPGRPKISVALVKRITPTLIVAKVASSKYRFTRKYGHQHGGHGMFMITGMATEEDYEVLKDVRRLNIKAKQPEGGGV